MVITNASSLFCQEYAQIFRPGSRWNGTDYVRELVSEVLAKHQGKLPPVIKSNQARPRNPPPTDDSLPPTVAHRLLQRKNSPCAVCGVPIASWCVGCNVYLHSSGTKHQCEIIWHCAVWHRFLKYGKSVPTHFSISEEDKAAGKRQWSDLLHMAKDGIGPARNPKGNNGRKASAKDRARSMRGMEGAVVENIAFGPSSSSSDPGPSSASEPGPSSSSQLGPSSASDHGPSSSSGFPSDSLCFPFPHPPIIDDEEGPEQPESDDDN